MEKEMFYGVFKRFATENHYTDLAKALNSAATTRDTKATIRPVTRKGIVYGHMSQLVIKDGICYATFIENPGDDGEKLYSRTSRIVLAVFPLERALSPDFEPEKDIVYRQIGGLGGTCAGFTAKSIFKCNSMCLVGDEICILFCFQTEDGRFRIFRKVYDIPTGTFGKEKALNLAYGEKVFPFDDAGVNAIYAAEGRTPAGNDVVEVVSNWSEYNGEYYATFLVTSPPNCGLVVKTADFETVRFVSTIPGNEHGTAEASSYIWRDTLFVACRQDYFLPYMMLTAYDLKSGKWYDPNWIEDGTSRPWFFEKDGELYLINTTEEYLRRYANISRIVVKPQWKLAGYAIDTVGTLYGCGFYFAVTGYEGRLFFLSTFPDGNTPVGFGELKLTQYDTDAVNERFLGLMEGK